MEYNTNEDVCDHGFRAMACSALIESGLWSQDAVERQMSHQERIALLTQSLRCSISMAVSLWA